MGTFLFKNKKGLTILLVIAAAAIVVVAIQLSGNDRDEGTIGDVLDPAFIFYRDLGTQFRDCGSENLNQGFGYNEDMRTCFENAHTSCTKAKLHQKIYTIEGDPIFTTLVIEGDAPKGCAVHTYTDSRDRFGSPGKSDTVCYSAVLDKSSGQDSFLLTQCENGTELYFY